MATVKTRDKESPLEVRIQDLHARSGTQLCPLGVAPLPKGPVMFTMAPPAEWDWAVLRLEEDPLYHRGELAMPREVRQKLARLDDAGVRFDDLLIAHEVPKADTLTTRGEEKPIMELVLTSRPAPSRQVLALEKFFTAIVSGASKFATVSASALETFSDPVLIGVLTGEGTAQPGTLAVYFEIARW